MNRDSIRNNSIQNKQAASSQGFLPELTDINSRENALSHLESPKKLDLKNKMFGTSDPPRETF